MASEKCKYHLQPMHLLSLAVLIVVFSLFMLTFSTSPGQESPVESFIAFLLIELACGLYFPSMSFLRRKVIPETEQAGVLNWFRVPLHLLACLGLLVLHDSDRKTGTRNMRGEGSCGGGGAPRDSAGSGATEEGLTSRGGRNLRLPLRFGLRPHIF